MLGTARISEISIQQGTQGDTLDTTHFDAFTGNFASVDWLDDTGIVEVELNASGIAYVNSVLGSTAKFCIRETPHDYDNFAPDADALHYGFLRYDENYPKLEKSGTFSSGIDLSVVAGSWWADLRPRKFRMTFDEATADVSLKDTNGVELYANATYPSGTEVYLVFAGADIARLVVTGSGDVTDIEFSQQVEKGSTLGSNRRTTRKESNAELGRTSLLDPNPIRASKRLPRRTDLRTMR